MEIRMKKKRRNTLHQGIVNVITRKARLNFGFVLSVTCSVCNISYRFNLKFY